MYDPQDLAKRMAAYLVNASSRLEGSFSMDNIQAVSQELAMMYYMTILPIPDNYLLDTASGEYLDRRAIDFNETRNPATYAEGHVMFKGAKDSSIPKSTGVQTETLTFETTQFAMIPETGFVIVPVICKVSGKIGNISANEIKNIRASDGLSNITVSNSKGFAGGTDEETDEAFRSRILEKIQRPYTSGNMNDYIRWAKQVSGVGNALCIPTWNGNGSVKVIILSNEGNIPDDIILQNVVDHIESNRPIGATVTVVKAVAKPINIHADIKLVSGYLIDDALISFKSYMKSYLMDKAFGTDKLLSYFKISDLLYNVTGIADVLDYTINNQRASVTGNPEEFYELQEVTFNVIT